MSRRDEALALYRQQFNCSQAIFTAYRDRDALDEKAALKLATVLGAGVACTGKHLCGAVSGALLAISMKHGRGELQDLEARGNTYAMAQRFMAEFERAFGSCVCEQIIGINIGTPENLATAREAKIFETRCLDAVKAAADILERML